MKFIALITILFSLSAHAEQTCLEKLTNDYERESRTFEFNADHVTDRDFGRDTLAFSFQAVRKALTTVGCHPKLDVNFSKSPLGGSDNLCREIIPGRHSSMVCYIESNLGYWVVSQGTVNNVVVTYYRWD